MKETSKVPVLCSLELVVATILGVLVFKENFPLASIAGIAMVLISIVLMSSGQQEERAGRQEESTGEAGGSV